MPKVCPFVMSYFPHILIDMVSLCMEGAITLSQLYKNSVAQIKTRPSRRTFYDWLLAGSNFALLAGGGTVYVLVLVAGLGLRTKIASMQGDISMQVANALRHPAPGTHVHQE